MMIYSENSRFRATPFFSYTLIKYFVPFIVYMSFQMFFMQSPWYGSFSFIRCLFFEYFILSDLPVDW